MFSLTTPRIQCRALDREGFRVTGPWAQASLEGSERVNEIQLDLEIGESVRVGRFQMTLLDIEDGEGHFRIDSDWDDAEEVVELVDGGRFPR